MIEKALSHPGGNPGGKTGISRITHHSGNRCQNSGKADRQQYLNQKPAVPGSDRPVNQLLKGHRQKGIEAHFNEKADRDDSNRKRMPSEPSDKSNKMGDKTHQWKKGGWTSRRFRRSSTAEYTRNIT